MAVLNAANAALQLQLSIHSLGLVFVLPVFFLTPPLTPVLLSLLSSSCDLYWPCWLQLLLLLLWSLSLNSAWLQPLL